jgi:hypothetical protein
MEALRKMDPMFGRSPNKCNKIEKMRLLKAGELLSRRSI